MRLLAAGLALVAIAATASAQLSREDMIQWLQQNAVRLEPTGTADDSDLEPLKAMIGDSRIVLLGEASHGDGKTFEVKSRLIPFLHREMGFDVLVFESGFYDCRRAGQAILQGKDPVASARSAIFSIWSESRQVQPLIRYLGQAARSQRPLELAGFDMQVTGQISRDHLLEDLEQFLKTSAPQALESPDWRLFGDALRNLLWNVNEFRAAPLSARNETLAAAKRLQDLLSERSPSDRLVRREHGYWTQATESLRELLRMAWALNPTEGAPRPDRKVFAIRESQMSRNMLFLAENFFAGRRIIVWGATSHLTRNRQSIETEVDPDMVPMGHALWEKLGSQTYVIGFASHQGSSAIARRNPRRPPHVLKPSPQGSLEDLMQSAGLDLALIDLRSQANGWLSERRLARPMGHRPMKADWTQVLDALVFIREMRPSTLAEAP